MEDNEHLKQKQEIVNQLSEEDVMTYLQYLIEADEEYRRANLLGNQDRYRRETRLMVAVVLISFLQAAQILILVIGR